MPVLAVLARCVPGCKGGPAPIFCDEHWKLVNEPLQRALVDEWNRLRPPVSMTPRLATLLKTASAEINTALSGDGRTHAVGAGQ